MDGPVVKAAARALEALDSTLVLPYVPSEGEEELRQSFAKAVQLREQSDEARELADRYFFETVVRIHRAGEGEPFTGLKPAGLDPGPAIPAAERAIETGSPDELVRVLCDVVEERARRQLRAVMELKEHANGDVEANRKYVSAMLGLQVWAHKLYQCAESAPHEAHHHTRRRVVSVALRALPDAEDVASGIAEGRHRQVSLRIRRRDRRASVGSDLLERVVHALHVDIGADAGLAGDLQVGHEVPDHMPGAVLEARILPVGVHVPAEHGLVEGGRPVRVLRRDPQVGDPGEPEHP
jgi:hypothetical protein